LFVVPFSIHAPRRAALALTAALVIVSVAAPVSLAQSEPVADPAPPIVDPLDGATPAVPDPTITGEQPTAWDHVTVSPDGRTLTVYFYNGAEGCYGLKDVQVDVAAGVPTITVLTGIRQDAISKLCIEIAQLYKTDVVLDAPILGGGVA
jgi:hypothetical protein